MLAPLRFGPLLVSVGLALGLAPVACGSEVDDSDAAEEEDAAPARTRDGGKSKPAFEAGFDPDEDEPGTAGTKDGGADGGTDGGAEGGPGSDPCADPDDPGGAENVAKVLPATDDCDNDFKTVKGVVKSAVDVDVYKLAGSDKTGCLLDTDFELKTAGPKLCVFARCKNSTVDAVTGCASGTAATSDLGLKGCCTSVPGHATPEWDCDGVTDDDSADFVIRVEPGTAAACLPYELKYRF